MSKDNQNKLRHEIYSILTDPNTLYLATNSHLKELDEMAYVGTTFRQLLQEASEAYLKECE